jgi:hypothetical protein
MNGRIFTTGLEFETDIIDSQLLEVFLRRNKIREYIEYHNDASAQFPTVLLNGLRIMERSKILFRNAKKSTTGIEVVTNVLDDAQVEFVVKGVLNSFSLAGELKTSVRGSTHIHIGFPNYYNWVYNFFTICVYLESFFFNIGGMGSGYRGRFNESIYSRPLTNPHCFLYNRGYFRLFDYEKMFASRPSEDTFWKLLLHRPGSPVPKYPPGRYLYVNFLSLITHGTLELRVLNNTLNPDYLNAVIDFFRNLCKLSVYISDKDVESLKACLEEDNHNKLETIVSLLSKNCAGGNLLDSLRGPTVETLHRLLDKTPKYVPNENILSHVADKITIDGETFMSTEIIRYRRFISGTPAPSGFLDTHQNAIHDFERLERNRELCAN